MLGSPRALSSCPLNSSLPPVRPPPNRDLPSVFVCDGQLQLLSHPAYLYILQRHTSCQQINQLMILFDKLRILRPFINLSLPNYLFLFGEISLARKPYHALLAKPSEPLKI